MLFHSLFLSCVLVLVAALAFTGAGPLAIVAVFVAVLAFYFLPFVPAAPVPVFARGQGRRHFPRAPPRF